MKIIHTILWWIFVFSIPIILISTVIRIEINFLPFYEYEYEKNHINQVTGFDAQQLRIITRHLMQYFNDKVDSAQMILEINMDPFYLFHDYELVHLEDVKEIFQYVYKIQMISMCYFLFFLIGEMISRSKNKWNSFWKGLRNGSLITIGALISLGIFMFFGFYQVFVQFHYLVFGDPQSSPWILDPRTDYLVMMYPLNFWKDATILGVTAIVTLSFLLMILSSFFIAGKKSFVDSSL